MSTYEYHPQTTFRLGGGVDPRNYADVIPSAIEYERQPIENTAIRTVVQASLIQSRRDLYSTLNVSAALAGNFAFVSAGGSLDFDRAESFNSDTMAWAIVGQTDFGRIEAAKPRLRADAKALIDAGQHDAFANRYGTEVVLQERRLAQIVVLCSVQNLSSDRRQQLTSSWQANISAGPVTVESSGAYRQLLSEIERFHAVRISAYALGGAGLSDLRGLFGDVRNLETVVNVIRHYCEGFSLGTAAPVLYATASMARFGWQGTPYDPVRRDRFLADLMFTYQDALRTKERVRQVLSLDGSSPLGRLISPGARATLRTKAGELEQLVEKIEDRAQNCRADSDKCSGASGLSLPSDIPWPVLPTAPRLVINSSRFERFNSFIWRYYATGQIVFAWESDDRCKLLYNGQDITGFGVPDLNPANALPYDPTAAVAAFGVGAESDSVVSVVSAAPPRILLPESEAAGTLKALSFSIGTNLGTTQAGGVLSFGISDRFGRTFNIEFARVPPE